MPRKVFVSSTSRDLIPYREQVRDAILGLGLQPVLMESFNPSEKNAVQVCYDKVQEADIFVGIYAHRYGHCPTADSTYMARDGERHCPGDRSITHLEYDWACEKSLPLRLFVISENEPWLPEHIEEDPGKSQLEAFKKHLQDSHTIGFFGSPDNLAARVTRSLSTFSRPEQELLASPTDALHSSTSQSPSRTRYLTWRLEDVNNRLKTSLHRAHFIDCRISEHPEAVYPAITHDPTSTPDRFHDAFMKYKGRVLLLGAPGSGKTTVLLTLAKDLLSKALDDPAAPVPLLFNLSQWIDDQQSIADWLIILTTQLPGVTVSPEEAALWVTQDRVALLLDGLDEVEEYRRERLVTALNTCLQQHPQMCVVICCREADYEPLEEKTGTLLRLEGAVVLQALEEAQIAAYLTKAEAVSLSDALLKDAGLRELARIPLTLSFMTQMHEDDPRALPITPGLVERRRRLFDTYVDRMMRREARRASGDLRPLEPHARKSDPPPQYTRQQVDRYLGWLAIRLSEQARTVFPPHGFFRFLEDAPDQGMFNAANITNAITMGLIGILMSWVWFTSEMRVFLPTLDLGALLVGMGIVMVISALLLHRLTRKLPRSSLLRVGKVLYFVTIHVSMSAWLDALYFEHSFLTALSRLPVVTLTSVVVGGLLNGLVNKARGTTRIGGLVGAIVGVAAARLVADTDLIAVKLAVGFVSGLISGAFVLWYARRDAEFVEKLLNTIARFTLWMRGYIPFRYNAFLEYATDALLLKKAGEDYEFTHRLLRDHFALLELTPRLSDPDVATRLLTVKRLVRLGETARECLNAAINDEDASVRQVAQQALDKLNNRPALSN